MVLPLSGIRVLDLTQNMCGPYCTQILGDLGAEIIKIEPPGGDILRRRGIRQGRNSLAFMQFNRGKKSVELDLEKPKQREIYRNLAKTADLVVEDMGPGACDRLGIGYEILRKEKPDLLYLSITGYGQEGKFKDYSPLDAVVQAVSGFMSITGEEGGEFTKAGVPLADLFTGIYGAIGALSAIFYHENTGRGLRMDAAKLRVMLASIPDSVPKYLNTGGITRAKGTKHHLAAILQALRTKDGAVICKASEDREFGEFARALGLGWMTEDPRFNGVNPRLANVDELARLVEEKTRQLTTREFAGLLDSIGCAAGPINTLEQILKDPYTAYHHLIMEVTDRAEGTFRVIGPPLSFDKFAWADTAFVPQPGEHTGEVLKELEAMERQEKEREKGGTGTSDEPKGGTAVGKVSPLGEQLREEPVKPLAGIRVLDLTRLMAGPLGTEILKDLGAEIIKIERGDGNRDLSRITDPVFGNTSVHFMTLNRGKKDLFLDLRRESHRRAFLRLAEKCDVIAENFRPGVMKRLGLSYEEIQKVRPDIIYSAVSGFGQEGPYRDRRCMDTIAQAMSGFMMMTGREGEEPIRGGSSVADICGALYEALGTLAALIYRKRTGEGCFVDVPMLSAMISLTDGAAAEYINCGKPCGRAGNRDRWEAFFETVPTKDGAVMVEAAEEEHFAGFMAALGLEDAAQDPDFKDSASRLAHREKLEELIFPAARSMTMEELAGLCRSRGIPAGEVNTLERIFRTGYMEEQKMAVRVHDRQEGDFLVLGLPLAFDGWERAEEETVPQPGEQSREILRGLLGMSEEEIESFYENASAGR